MKHLADASLAVDGTLDHVDQAKLATARHRYHSALLIGERGTAARASPLIRKHHALARRLRQREDDYLRYTHDSRVPFDNNTAEREIRMSKLRIKISGCMRSMTGAEAFCAIRSYLSTAAKHGLSMLDALTRATSRADDVDTYLALVPEGRRAVLSEMRDACRTLLAGFAESMRYGMPAYSHDGVTEIA